MIQNTNAARRANILNKLKKHASQNRPIPPLVDRQHIYEQENEDPAVIFAREFTHLGGHFVYCHCEHDAVTKLAALIRREKWTKLFCEDPSVLSLLARYDLQFTTPYPLEHCHFSITFCTHLVARVGAVVIDSQKHSRVSMIYAPVHVCIAYSNQIVPDIADIIRLYTTPTQTSSALSAPSLVSFIAGPSKTADIEKTLVKGVHGPGDVYVFFIHHSAE